MKKFLVLIVFFSLFIFDVQSQNSFPTSGNVGINLGASTSLNKLQIGSNSQGWSGNDLVLSNSSGSIAIHNDVTHTYLYGTNDIAIRPGFGQMALYAKSNGYIGIGTTQPNSPLSIKGRVGIRADANPSIAGEALRVEGGIAVEENVMNVTNLVDQDFVVRLSGVGAGPNKRTLIGPTVATRFSLSVGVNSGNEYLTLVNGGNVGIGTVTPTQKLDVNGNINIAGAAGRRLFMGGVGGTTFGIAYDANNPNYGMFYTEAAVDYISLSPNGNANNGVMNIYGDGAVGIGTTTPGNFKLAVNGKIWGTEVQVALTNPGPDYVFEKSYALPTLEEVKSYIDQNKHLPEVPSAKEMEANGVNVGEMNMLLLKKIEELTLYLIEKDKAYRV
jgi:hypothetical protein